MIRFPDNLYGKFKRIKRKLSEKSVMVRREAFCEIFQYGSVSVVWHSLPVLKYCIHAALRGRSIVLYELHAMLSYGIPPFVVVAVFFCEQDLI